jgi:similar to stage IV sporulation protein
MHLRVFKKAGLPFILHKQKKHAGLIVGLCFFVLLLGFLSSRVWVIGVSGNELTESRILLQLLEEKGVHTGMRGSALKPREIGAEMLEAMPQLDWIALNLRGSALEILVREHAPDARGEEPESPADVVASYDGQLIFTRIYAGSKAVPDGSAVRKGDVLIKGMTENSDGSRTPVRAKGYIVARTEHRLKQHQPIAVSSAGRRRRLNRQFAVWIFGLRLPLYFRAHQDAWKSVRYFSAGDSVLPLGLETLSRPADSPQNAPLTESQAELLALEKLHAQADELLEYKEVRSFSTERKVNESGAELTVSYVLLESVGLAGDAQVVL